MSIGDKIRAYHEGMIDLHHRYRSWEHCYQYFHGATPAAVAADRDVAALRLGFYLASWGMYRGSGFLLQNAYTVHLGVIDSYRCKTSDRSGRTSSGPVGTMKRRRHSSRTRLRLSERHIGRLRRRPNRAKRPIRC